MNNCFFRKYEYTFVYNNETYIADKCFSNFYGTSYCEKDGVTYNNVEYKSVIIGCEEYKNQNNFVISETIINITIFFIIFLIILSFIKLFLKFKI